MKISEAKQTAKQWVYEFSKSNLHFQGAYFSGSIMDQLEDAEQPPTSDIDIMVVLSDQDAPPKLGKFMYHDVLLEVTFLSWNQLTSAEQVLSAYHFAGSFRKNTIISDPTGRLTSLYQAISGRFADIKWVRARCRDAYTKIENGIAHFDESRPYHDLVINCLFPAGITTHVILVAALKNPTIRLRYLAARDVLHQYGYDEFYTQLIQLLGCSSMTSDEVSKHIDELENVFDAAVSISKTQFLFSSDITQLSKPIVIDGSRNLVGTGYHREAIFWIVATFARCHTILATDAPDQQAMFLPAFEHLMASLGLQTKQNFINRTQETHAILPELWNIAERIMSKNPHILS